MGNQVQQQSFAGGKVVVRQAEASDAYPIFKKLRDSDRAELHAHGLNPLQAIVSSILESDKSYCMEYLGDPVFIFGVKDSNIEGLGAVWGMGTYTMRPVHRLFLRHCRSFLPELQEGYKAIGNIVDARNTLHRRWLEWMGFEFGHTIKYGPLDLPFINFILRS